MDETMFTIIKYVGGILAVVVFRYLIPQLSLKLKDSKYANLVDFVEKAINAAESIYKLMSGSGEEKKQYVVEKVKEYIKSNGIKVTDDQVDMLIEAVFTELDGYTVNKNK